MGKKTERLESQTMRNQEDQRTSSVIAEFRKKKGMTQTALALAIGVNQKDISRWERGKHKPTIGMLIKLSAALNCTLEELIEEQEHESEHFCGS